jgi:hypothetical protein
VAKRTKAETTKPVGAKPDISKRIALVPAGLMDSITLMADQRGVEVADILRLAVANFQNRDRPYGLGVLLGFGPYATEDVETVIRVDPRYIHWCLQTVNGFVLDLHACNLLRQIDVIDRAG